ncbi:uncharacterized protein EAE97_005428 [Botrytis byssoidea]|uniref:Uncharacterized protein n=1 Tax=Botrytis byssoidea TaxID=139641 RepID=A0A9P5IKH1_9HELO|nr:uncharacterized protein EAE97_005428 [Botrytis byssoidea]KAF7944795.1 hypothetical protein EAE97_005428 [Botrytis byssoidea]
MNFSLGQLYDQFTIRPKEMTAWEMEDWIDEKSKRSGRGYYIPKGEIFCRALNKDGSLCKLTKRVGPKNILAHCIRNHAIEYHGLAPRKSDITKEYGTWEELTFVIKVNDLLEKQLETEKVTQVQQSSNASGATEQHDLALISLKRPRTDVSSTTSGGKAIGAKSIAAMGKAPEMQTGRQKIVSPRREGIGKRAITVERTTLSAGGTIENPQRYADFKSALKRHDTLTFDVHRAPADIKGTIRTTSGTASRREVARNRISHVFQ